MLVPNHYHRFRISRQIGFFSFGAISLLLSIGILVNDLPRLFSGRLDLISFVVLLVFEFFMFPLGLFFVAGSLTTKVLITPEALEYHNPALILSAKWQNLECLEQQKSGKRCFVVAPTEGDVELRAWAKAASSLFREDPRTFWIETFHYGDSNGHSLSSDIISHLTDQDGPRPFFLRLA